MATAETADQRAPRSGEPGGTGSPRPQPTGPHVQLPRRYKADLGSKRGHTPSVTASPPCSLHSRGARPTAGRCSLRGTQATVQGGEEAATLSL